MNYMRMVANVLSMYDEISWMPMCVKLRVMCMWCLCDAEVAVLVLVSYTYMLFAPNFFDLTDIDFQVLKQKCVSVLYPSLVWL